MSRRTIVLLATLVFLEYATVLSAQQAAHKWSFALGVASSTSHEQTDVAELAMRQAHFDSAEPGSCFFFIFCWGPAEHPSSTRGDPNATWSVQYHFSRNLAVKGHYFSTSLGSTDGYHADHWDVSMGTSVSGFGVLAAANLGVLSVGAGPALVRSLAAGPDESFKSSRLGFVVEGSARFPARSTVFFELQFQRRFIGSARVGPFSAQAAWGYTGTSRGALPAFRQQLSHSVFGVGTGLRL